MAERAAESVQQVATSAAARSNRLWHAAANDDERAKALAGESFRTRCGQTVRCNPAGQRTPRKARQLAPMEPCVVCRLSTPPARTAHVSGGESRGAGK